ncbi:LysR family transcriptional regulator [Pseudomonas sp. 5B4]|nr:LysR family transcriptional regulator [Pseudomonas sp. 5B4]MEB0271713.1 LysR family transcriptional regulator [Pseudomonas sp. 5B4]
MAIAENRLRPTKFQVTLIILGFFVNFFQVLSMKLSLDHLVMLQCLSEVDSITAVAERLWVTPSAVSHRIREAERRLGVKLTERAGGKLRLSPAGVRLERAARDITAILNEAEADASSMAGGVSAFVRLGVTSYGPFRWIPKFIKHYAALRPDIEITLVMVHRDEIYTSLIQGKLDVSIIDDGMVPSSVAKLPLFRDELIAIMATDHPLAGRHTIHAEDFKTYNLVTYSTERSKGWEYDRFFAPAGVLPRRMITVEVIEAIIELVRSGYGLSILQRDLVTPSLERGELAWAALNDGLDIAWNAIVRPAEPEGSEVNQMVTELTSWMTTQRNAENFQDLP